MRNLPLSEANYIAYELLSTHPPLISTRFLYRALGEGCLPYCGRYDDDARFAAYIRKVIEKLHELDEAYRLPHEDPSRPASMASKYWDLADALNCIIACLKGADGFLPKASRRRNATRYGVATRWQSLGNDLTKGETELSLRRPAINLVSATRRVLLEFAQQTDVNLTFRFLNETVQPSEDYEGWYLRQVAVPAHLAEVRKRFTPSHWREIPLRQLEGLHRITPDILNRTKPRRPPAGYNRPDKPPTKAQQRADKQLMGFFMH